MHAPDPRINLKDPWLAGILAFLLPGAGHLYQGRTFKAMVFAVCILGLFFSGMAIAGWKAVQAPPLTHRNIPTSRITMLKFAAQASIGLPMMYSVYQSHRYYQETNEKVIRIDAPINSPFEGELDMVTESGNVSGLLIGTVTLRPAQGLYTDTIEGSFEGSLDGKPLSLELRHANLDKPVGASRLRVVSADVVDVQGDRSHSVGHVHGGIPRPLKDWLMVPLDKDEELDLHRELGKYHEMAMVFTWVAGLLNILAIWDAVGGPAYGYGDEESTVDEA